MDYYIHPLGKPVLRITGDGVQNILLYSNNHFELHEYIEELKDCYLSSSLNSGTGDVDFDDPTYQACYVFLYFPPLCYGIFYGLQKCEEHFGTLFERASEQSDCLRVCSLGGGPGTDLFGIRMFLNHTGYEDVPVRATVFDRHPNWELAFQRLSSELRPCNVYAKYCRMEVMESVQRGHLQAIAGADLITCSKFISAVRALPNSRQNLTKLLRQAKPGAYLFYLDNSKGGNTEFIRSLLQNAGFTEFICFERGEDNPFQLPNTEHSRYLGDLPKWFNFNSQRNLRVTFMLWRKNGQCVTSSISSNRNKPTEIQNANRVPSAQNTASIRFSQPTPNKSSSHLKNPIASTQSFTRPVSTSDQVGRLHRIPPTKSSTGTHIRQPGFVISSKPSSSSRSYHVDRIPSNRSSNITRQLGLVTSSTSSSRAAPNIRNSNLTRQHGTVTSSNRYHVVDVPKVPTSSTMSGRNAQHRQQESSCCPCVLL